MKCAARTTRPEPLDVDVLCVTQEHAFALLRALSAERINAAAVTALAVHVRAAGEDITRAHSAIAAHAPAAEIIRREQSLYPHHANGIREAKSGPIVDALVRQAERDAKFGKVRPNELDALRVLAAEQTKKITRALERARKQGPR